MNYRLVSLSGLAYAGEYVAVPEAIYNLHHMDDTTWEDDDYPEGVVVLGDDEVEAQREFALRVHLDDWSSVMKVKGNRICVNPRKQRFGSGPGKAQDNVTLLRSAIARIRPKINSVGHFLVDERGFDMVAIRNAHLDRRLPSVPVPAHELTVFDLKDIGYDTLYEWLKQDCPELLSVGTHEVLNTLYFLVKGDSSSTEGWTKMLTKAWYNEKIVDTRPENYTDDGEYMVLTDYEADQAWEEELDHYIDDCMEIPESIERYFDREAWKRDARMDGRGHVLSSYDGQEHWVTHDDLEVSMFIYRTN